ncbi:MAG: Ig-like domain-containing protein [Limisphaerales bacterium]
MNVSAPSVPPIVFITDPANNTVFAEPANVTIQASATDSDGTVTNVQFLLGSPVLANKSLPPFSVVASNLAAGSYTLSAIASDNLGAKATNSVSITVVTPVALTISGGATIAARKFSIQLCGQRGIALRRATLDRFDLEQLDGPHHQYRRQQSGDFRGHLRDEQSRILSRRPVAESVRAVRKFYMPLWLLAVSALLCSLPLSLPVKAAGLPFSSNTSGSSERVFAAKGVVEELKLDEQKIVIRHEAVSNFMAAMTMPFKVKETNELAGLSAGGRNFIPTACDRNEKLGGSTS